MTITYPTAFAKTPSAIEATINGLSLDAAGTVPFNPTYFVSIGVAPIQSDNGETWINMPVTETELYGTTNHETALSTDSVPVTGVSASDYSLRASFAVNCLVGSSNATAILRPQFSDALNAGAWTDLASAAGALDINVGTNCPVQVDQTTILQNVNPDYNTQNSPFEPLRIVGLNGGGIGDTPMFNNIQIQVFVQQYATPTVCTTLGFVCSNVSTKDSATKAFFEIDFPRNVAAFIVSYPYVWVSWQATE